MQGLFFLLNEIKIDSVSIFTLFFFGVNIERKKQKIKMNVYIYKYRISNDL